MVDDETWPSEAALASLVRRFQNATLPKSEWTHAAHLAVGAWHVAQYGPVEALKRLRAAIVSLNEAHGTANTDTSGYHETITCAYVMLFAALAQDGSAAAVQAILASPLAAREALLGYYSRERLMSASARRKWVEPDLQPLPAIVSL